MHTSSITRVSPLDTRKLLTALFSLMAGALLVFTVGFAPMDVAHNAAHDTRHSAAFPCH